MKDDLMSRCKQIGIYMTETKCTVRQAAKLFGISKSTVNTDVTINLKKVDRMLADEVEKVLQRNKAERHLRGGIATKLKYQKLQS